MHLIGYCRQSMGQLTLALCGDDASASVVKGEDCNSPAET